MAGKKWFYSFMKRHPTLSLRQPEYIKMARVKGFNKEHVSGFFDILEKVVDGNNIDALRIFNVDESGFSTVQKPAGKVLDKKGKHQIGALSNAGVNSTSVSCASASGVFVPPMIIFKRQRNNLSLQVGAPPGSLVEVYESGYINSELSVKWLNYFINHVKPATEKMVLLVL
jgi:hypothetical protein